MAFCRNCGCEYKEGVRFCESCGAPVGMDRRDELVSSRQDRTMAGAGSGKLAWIDRYGKFFGIILFMLAIVDYVSDPAFLTIVLSIAIVCGCIFCFNKKYKLKVFTILAMVRAIFCFCCGISQASRVGLFRMPEYYNESNRDKDNADDKTDSQSSGQTNASAPVVEKSVPVEKSESVKKSEVSNDTDTSDAADVSTKEKVDGVDPDLKEFLDGYEAFMDDYVAFMKNYNDNPANALSMMSDYLEILEKYEDFVEKIDSYDSDEMSTADAKYYLEVINRCNQKMLDLY